jgi:hypothetical protein
MKFPRLPFVSWRNFLVSPGTVCDGPFEQSTIFEVVRENRFEKVQIRSRFEVFQNARNYTKEEGWPRSATPYASTTTAGN